MEKAFSPRELLIANGWSSLLFTTYSLSLSFLEAVPLAAANRTFKNFTVLTDLVGYLSSLSDVGAIGAGRDYDLVPVKVDSGVFHPKVALLSDEAGNIRAMVGSGNLSFGGWGYNNEVLEVLRPGKDSRCFSDLAVMLEGIENETMVGDRLKCLRPAGLDKFIDVARRAALAPGEGRSRLLHTMTGPLVPQIRSMTDDLGGARFITIVSPFFSAHHGVKALLDGLQCSEIAIAVPPKAPSIFDFVAAAAAGLPAKRVTSDLFDDAGRSLHSKLYHIECARGHLVVSGSANATTAALGGQNVEAVVARPFDTAITFGWRETTRGDAQATGEREPLETASAGLVADFNGGVISGRVAGMATSGDWEAFLSSGTKRVSAGIVTVDATGSFTFEPPAAMDPTTLGASAQVIFIQGDLELRGWLILRDLIRAISRRGPIARAIGRVMSGLDTLGDVGAILDYFAREPTPLFDAAERTGGGKKERLQSVHVRSSDVSALKGISALDMAPTWLGGDAGHSGDALIDALVRHLAKALPQSNDDAANDDDEEDASITGSMRKQGGLDKNVNRGQRLQKPIVEKAFEQLFKKLETHPSGSSRSAGLFLLFDMMIQIVPRSEEPDELLPILMSRWLRAASNARPTDVDPTALDQCIAIIAARMVIFDTAKAGKMHEFLQSWLGGELDADFKLLFEPNGQGVEESRIYPGGRDEEWQEAWSDIVSSRTQWTVMRELQQAVAEGRAGIVLPKCVKPDEERIVRKAATGKTDKISYITSRDRGTTACPKCYMALPVEQQARLRRDRIASCKGMRCDRVIIDLSL